MLPIPTKVLHVHKLYYEYFETVQVGRADFSHTSAGDHAMKILALQLRMKYSL